MDYIKTWKTVELDSLAAEFGMKVQDTISLVQSLEAAGKLTGIMDDRGKVGLFGLLSLYSTLHWNFLIVWMCSTFATWHTCMCRSVTDGVGGHTLPVPGNTHPLLQFPTPHGSSSTSRPANWSLLRRRYDRAAASPLRSLHRCPASSSIWSPRPRKRRPRSTLRAMRSCSTL